MYFIGRKDSEALSKDITSLVKIVYHMDCNMIVGDYLTRLGRLTGGIKSSQAILIIIPIDFQCS